MRISIVTGFFLPVPPVSGGATEKIWYRLARIFAEQGHKVTFVSRRWPGLPDKETESGIDHIRIKGFDHTPYLAVNLVLDLIWGIRVTRALPTADAVICNTVALPVWLHRIRPSAGVVSVVMGRAPKGQVAFYGDVARIYSPSSSVAGRIASQGAASRVQVTGNPVDWSRLSRASRQGGNPVTLGYVGRVHPEKGISLLLAAVRHLASMPGIPEWRLKIVGPVGVREGGGGEEWAKALQDEARLSTGDRIEWLGAEYDPDRLAALYGTMDIFCYPSLAEKGETFGVSVAEAMAARCAVVVSALSCFSDLVDDGKTGLVFAHRDKNPYIILAECIARLLTDPHLRLEMAARGQERSRQFDYPEVSGRILKDLAFLTGADGEKQQR